MRDGDLLQQAGTSWSGRTQLFGRPTPASAAGEFCRPERDVEAVAPDADAAVPGRVDALGDGVVLAALVALVALVALELAEADVVTVVERASRPGQPCCS
jgi:hypothetical protein